MLVRLSLLLAFALALAVPAAAQADATGYVKVKKGTHPLSDRQAAKRVHGHFEPRPQNHAANHRMPSHRELRLFRRQNTANPYSKWVTGHYTGTTDQIIQWAAAKWGLSPTFMRSVADSLGPESRWVHLGLTSSDVWDTATSLQMMAAADLLLAQVAKLREVVSRRAVEHKDTICVGRTRARSCISAAVRARMDSSRSARHTAKRHLSRVRLRAEPTSRSDCYAASR